MQSAVPPVIALLNCAASTKQLLLDGGWRVAEFRGLEELLSSYRENPQSCVVANFHAAEGTGDELLRRLLAESVELPVVLVFEEQPAISQIVRAFRLGACDVVSLAKEMDRLPAVVRGLLQRDARRHPRRLREARSRRRMQMLTQGETEVLQLVLNQVPNVKAAKQLGISVRTVERRRNSIFTKLGVESVVELWTVVHDAGNPSGPHAADRRST